MKRPDISIVLLTWNRRGYLEKGLPELYGKLSRALTHEILIMDNASEDGTLDLVMTYANHPETRVIANKKNVKFKGYNSLFGMARGRIIIELDDDVIEYPHEFDQVLLECLDFFPEYGYIALDTIKNEKTDGGWPGCNDASRKTTRKGLTLSEGPARGYCAAFRRRDYRMIRPFTFFFPFSLSKPQDYVISGLIRRILHKKSGVVDNVKCLHANGPLYAKEFGRIEFDRRKMAESDCQERLIDYDAALKNGTIYSP